MDSGLHGGRYTTHDHGSSAGPTGSASQSAAHSGGPSSLASSPNGTVRLTASSSSRVCVVLLPDAAAEAHPA